MCPWAHSFVPDSRVRPLLTLWVTGVAKVLGLARALYMCRVHLLHLHTDHVCISMSTII